MLHIALQLWGGTFYLLNKIFFLFKEREEGKKALVWQARSWKVYLCGLPAWLLIFLSKRNWIAASVELGGAPSMVLGLIRASRNLKKDEGLELEEKEEPAWLIWTARIMVMTGLGISLYDFGGIVTESQILELGLAAGFLIGTYLLARDKPSGYLWFLLMNASSARLMFIQNFPWLALQQVISFGIVAAAYLVEKRKAQARNASTPSPIS